MTVLATDRSGRLARAEERDGVRRRCAAAPGRPRRDYYLSPGLAAEVIARGDWDLVHVQGVHTFVPPLAMAAARASRTPYVLTFHSGGHSSAGRAPGPRRAVAGAGAAAAPAPTTSSRSAASSAATSREATGIDPARFTVVRNGGALPPVRRRHRARSRAGSSPAAGSSTTRATTARSRRCR